MNIYTKNSRLFNTIDEKNIYKIDDTKEQFTENKILQNSIGFDSYSSSLYATKE